jgi:hypothetical protein
MPGVLVMTAMRVAAVVLALIAGVAQPGCAVRVGRHVRHGKPPPKIPYRGITVRAT